MSARMNGYASDRERRPASEQMADLHVYLVPPDIWREKYHNALNQNINETVSLGFIRVHPETKIYALRDEIEKQLGDQDIPREYVFVKSVGRSLTRLKSRQETTLKVKNFLPPQAYAPELYLLEATPEVRQQIAASSENSTRPQSRTSYDYEFMQRQSEESVQIAKLSNTSNGADLSSQYHKPLPRITPCNSTSPQNLNQPIVVTTLASSYVSAPRELTNQNVQQHNKQFQSLDWDTKNKQNNDYPDNQSQTNIGHSQHNLRVSDPASDSAPTVDPPQHHLASSPRRRQQGPQEEYLQPLSATPPHNVTEKDKHSKHHHGNHGNQHKHDEDSGIAGFTPDTYRENEPLDRRKVDNLENDRLKAPSPEGERLNRSQDANDLSDWERRRQEEQDEARREEEERRRREEEEARRDEREREDIAEQARLQKSDSDQELTRYPSPPPLRLASPDRDTASARARRMKQKEELLRELEEAREERRAAERQREELVKHAKQMQTKTQNRRNHARDLWKKRYFEEKKKTGPLEEQCNRLRHELDIIHKKLLTTLEGPREKATKLNDIKPSNKVGSPGRPLVSSDINSSRTPSPVASPARNTRVVSSKLFDNKGYNSARQTSPTREIASPDFDSLRSKYNSARMSLRVDSPTRGRSNSPNVRNFSTTQVRKSESFLEKPTPRQGWTEVSNSPRQPTHRGRRPVMTGNDLDKFSLHFMKAKKEHQQYPVDLVGSDRKQEYFESDQFDSDYDSKQSSARSILATKSPDRLDGTTRKNVQFDKNVNVIPHGQN